MIHLTVRTLNSQMQKHAPKKKKKIQSALTQQCCQASHSESWNDEAVPVNRESVAIEVHVDPLASLAQIDAKSPWVLLPATSSCVSACAGDEQRCTLAGASMQVAGGPAAETVG